MKKIQYAIAAFGVFLFISCKKDEPATPLVSVGINSATQSPATENSIDDATMIKSFTVSKLSGKVNSAKVRFQGKTTFVADLELYLESPSGRMLQLCKSESNPDDRNAYPYIDVTFSDAAATPVTDWKSVSTTGFAGIFKPKGDLTPGYQGYTGTLTAFNGYKGDAVNGIWTLYICDHAQRDIFDFTSWELFLSTVN